MENLHVKKDSSLYITVPSCGKYHQFYKNNYKGNRKNNSMPDVLNSSIFLGIEKTLEPILNILHSTLINLYVWKNKEQNTTASIIPCVY